MPTASVPGPAQSFRPIQVDLLPARIYPRAAEMMDAAAALAAGQLRAAIRDNGKAAAIMATGNTQLVFLEKLAQEPGIDWGRVTLFHMDEYLGIAAGHPSSFRRYLREKVEAKVKPGAFHYLAGDALEPILECDRYAELLRRQPIDLCMAGVGENGHIAFNDPAVANFNDPYPVKLVKLDEVSRLQQVKQGHFRSIDEMPQYAFTLTIPTLCASRMILCLSTEGRKAAIVAKMLRGPISAACPASVLRQTKDALFLMDEDSASML